MRRRLCSLSLMIYGNILIGKQIIDSMFPPKNKIPIGNSISCTCISDED